MKGYDKTLSLLLKQFKHFYEAGALPVGMEEYLLMLFPSTSDLSETIFPILFQGGKTEEETRLESDERAAFPLSHVDDFSDSFENTTVGQLFKAQKPLLAKPSSLARSLSDQDEEYMAVPISIHTSPRGFAMIPAKMAHQAGAKLAKLLCLIAYAAFQEHLRDTFDPQELPKIKTADDFIHTYTRLCLIWLHPRAYEVRKNGHLLENGASGQLGDLGNHSFSIDWNYGQDRYAVHFYLPVFCCFSAGAYRFTNEALVEESKLAEQTIREYFTHYAGLWELMGKRVDADKIKQELYASFGQFLYGTAPQQQADALPPYLPHLMAPHLFSLYTMDGFWEMYFNGKRVNVNFNTSKSGITAIYLLFAAEGHKLTPLELYLELKKRGATKKRKHEPGTKSESEKVLRIDDLQEALYTTRKSEDEVGNWPNTVQLDYWRYRLNLLQALLVLSSRRSYIKEIAFVKAQIDRLILLADSNFSDPYKSVFLNQADRADKNNTDTIVKGIDKAIDLFKPNYPALYQYLSETLILRREDGSSVGHKPFAFAPELSSDPALRNIRWVTMVED